MAGKSEVELLARKLAEKISDYLSVAYNHGYIDGSRDNCKPDRSGLEKRIGRVYLENDNIMIASNDRGRVQHTVLIECDKNILIKQINVMIEDAEERGRKEGSSHTSI